ncbi:MAG: hypothetical protein EA406_11420 [Rhodospirillales bacterium]|nr:MAG: hypothetical protein EA406_11420 [Rhodospirillales bacterium]
MLLKAMLAGFVIAVPIGAIGALCLRRGLQGRWLMAVATGFGAAAADAVLATAALFGLSLIVGTIVENQELLRFVGGLVLLYLGARMIVHRHDFDAPSPGTVVAQRERKRDLSGAVSTGFVLTLVNPAILIAFFAVFAALGLMEHESQSGVIIGGAFAGSMLWWLTLIGLAVGLRDRIPLGILAVTNGALGAVVMLLGIASWMTLLRLYL